MTDIKPMAYPSRLFPLGLWRPEMKLSLSGRLVPAQPATFRIAARTNYTTPLSNMLSSDAVAGEISFTPKPDEIYSVRGEIGDNYSAVWIADSTGTPVTPRIERGQRGQ